MTEQYELFQAGAGQNWLNIMDDPNRIQPTMDAYTKAARNDAASQGRVLGNFLKWEIVKYDGPHDGEWHQGDGLRLLWECELV